MIPILYSFRRCPFAIRARIALHFSGINVELREVSLSYDLPSSILDPIGAKGGSFGITGRNFLLQTDFPDIDPEISLVGAGKARGVEYFTNPNTESFLFNVKLNF